MTIQNGSTGMPASSARTAFRVGIRPWFCLLALALPAAAQWRTGYFMQAEAADQTAATIPWSKYTHIIHSALRPTYNNGICGLDTNSGLLSATNVTEFVNGAHASGVKAIIGIREDDTLAAITACTAPQNIAQFVELIRTFVANGGYDGVDLDWESGIIAPQYQDLTRRLRIAMPTATLSVAVGIAERFMTAAVQYDLDQINIRAYDLDSQDVTGSAINYTWYHSPTLQGANTQNQAMDILSWCYVYAGNASSKLGLAVPFYGRMRKGCLNDTSTNGVSDPNQAWAGRAESGFIPYRALVNSTYWTVGTHLWDDSRKSQYIQYRDGSCATDAFISYVGPEQLHEVVALIEANKLGGIATYGLPYEYVATLGGDNRYPLSTAIYNAMVHSPVAPEEISTPRNSAATVKTPSSLYRSTNSGTRMNATPMAATAPASGSRSPSAGTSISYYVDAVSGSDANPGTAAKPWKTLAKVNSTNSFAPGDEILLKRGSVWNDTLVMHSSGSITKPILITCYGTSGGAPVIDGQHLRQYNIRISPQANITVRNLDLRGSTLMPLDMSTGGVSVYDTQVSDIFSPSARTINVVSARRWHGAWLPGIYHNPTTAIGEFASSVGSSPALVNVFVPWASPWATEVWNDWLMDGIVSRGATPMITWEPWDWGSTDPADPTYSLDRILNGDHDLYITAWARAAAQWGKPFLLRFAHEMNGDWSPWSVGDYRNNNTAAKYVAAWVRIHELFLAAGARNVKWVWCPDGGPNLALLQSLYPGDKYVDYISVDRYNWGGVYWQDSYTAFAPAYDTISRISQKPFFIGETGSAEEGGNKADYISRMLAYTIPVLLPRITGVCWFNEAKQRDWRITSSASSAFSYSQAVQTTGWSSRLH